MAGKVRDFVYLDWERVRSIAAQLLHGIPEGSTKEKGHEVATKGNLEVSLLSVLKGGAEGDYRYFRTENETRSLHHYVYSLMEEELNEQGLLTVVNNKFNYEDWTPEVFGDGKFVKIVGAVRLMDYAWISEMMEALPKLMRTTQYFAMQDLKQRHQAGFIEPTDLKAIEKDHERQLKEIKALKIDELTGLVRRIYGEVVRIKVVPDWDHIDKVFVGTGHLSHFNETAASLSQKYGYEVDAGWVTLGQMNFSKPSDEPVSIPIGNQMEDAFEALAFALNDVMRIASATTWPIVSFTPICIYRQAS